MCTFNFTYNILHKIQTFIYPDFRPFCLNYSIIYHAVFSYLLYFTTIDQLIIFYIPK